MDLLTSLIREGLYLCYMIIPNWGMAIVLLTLVIRLVLFPLQIFTLRQQEKMKRLKPKLDELQERLKSDGRRHLAERSVLLKENGVKPALLTRQHGASRHRTLYDGPHKFLKTV